MAGGLFRHHHPCSPTTRSGSFKRAGHSQCTFALDQCTILVNYPMKARKISHSESLPYDLRHLPKSSKLVVSSSSSSHTLPVLPDVSEAHHKATTTSPQISWDSNVVTSRRLICTLPLSDDDRHRRNDQVLHHITKTDKTLWMKNIEWWKGGRDGPSFLTIHDFEPKCCNMRWR